MLSKISSFLCLALVTAAASAAEEKPPWREVTFPSPGGGVVSADLYEGGEHGVVLAHGRVFDKTSWRDLATRLSEEGLTALPIDFRGYGSSKAGDKEGVDPQALHEDILAAVVYLRDAGVERVSVIGGSMGGGAAARAAVNAEKGAIDRLILLSPVPIEQPEAIRARSVLYVVSGEERLFEAVRGQYESAPEPKRLEVLEGDAHAQHIFKTDLGPALTEIIVQFLLADPGE